MFAVAALVLAACGTTTSAPTEQRIYATEALAQAPVVRSQSTINRYAGVFGTACLDQSPAYEQTTALLEQRGFTLLQGPVGGNERRGAAYSDGTAYAYLFVRKDGFVICEVAFKTPDDDPLLRALATQVRQSQFSKAEQMGAGLVGSGFMIKDGRSVAKMITVSRQKRSSQSPSSFTLLDIK